MSKGRLTAAALEVSYGRLIISTTSAAQAARFLFHSIPGSHSGSHCTTQDRNRSQPCTKAEERTRRYEVYQEGSGLRGFDERVHDTSDEGKNWIIFLLLAITVSGAQNQPSCRATRSSA